MFLLKKIVGPLFYPLFICLATLVTGMVMLWFTKRQKAGKIIVSAGIVLLIIASYGWLSEAFLKNLEQKYPPLLKTSNLSQIKWIVVLGGGHVSDPNQPGNNQLSGPSLARLVEGLRLHNSLPGTKLVFSGGAGFDIVPEARTMADVASALGVERQKMVLENESKDTEEQAKIIKKVVGNEPFILVTSASHMPRSMALFKKQGMQPLPGPADFIIREDRGQIVPGIFFPGANRLEMAERAIHEYLGIIWAKLRGRI